MTLSLCSLLKLLSLYTFPILSLSTTLVSLCPTVSPSILYLSIHYYLSIYLTHYLSISILLSHWVTMCLTTYVSNWLAVSFIVYVHFDIDNHLYPLSSFLACSLAIHDTFSLFSAQSIVSLYLSHTITVNHSSLNLTHIVSIYSLPLYTYTISI